MHNISKNLVLPNVCHSAEAGGVGWGVHNVLHFPGVFVKEDLITIFYCK